MNLDDFTIYRFVRMDLSEEDQAIQLGHAQFIMLWPETLVITKAGHPRIVDLDGGASEKAFTRTIKKLREKGVPLSIWSDPDRSEWGITSICTPPLSKEQSLPLANYRLRRYSPPIGTSPTVGSKPSGEPSFRSSRAEEHLPFRQEVVGSTPTGSSSSKGGI